MYDLLARTWGLVVFRGVVAVAFGVVAIIWPQITLLGLVILWGAYAVVDGIAAIAVGASGAGAERWLMVLIGVFGLIAGIVAFVWPGITALVLLFVIAGWAIVIGVLSLVSAWRLRGESTGVGMLVVTGLAAVVLGIALFAQPAGGAVGLVVLIGTLAIVWGVFTFLLGMRMRKASKLPPTSGGQFVRP